MTWQCLALVLSGAFLYALYHVTNKKLLVKSAPADCISTTNFLGGGLLLLAVSLLFDPPKIQSWTDWPNGLIWPLLATSLLNIVILFGSVRALQYGDASLIQPMSAAQPMIVLIPSMLILGEIPGFLGWFGLFMIAFGTYIFSIGEKVEGWQRPKSLEWLGSKARYLAPWQMLLKNRGVQIALLVAACGAFAVNFDKMSVLRSSAIFPPALILLFCGLIGLLKTLHTKEWQKVTVEHRTSLITNPIIFAVVLILFWTAFHFGFAAYVGALKRFQIPFTMVLAFWILKEQGVKKRWPGAIIMACGAVLLSL